MTGLEMFGKVYIVLYRSLQSSIVLHKELQMFHTGNFHCSTQGTSIVLYW